MYSTFLFHVFFIAFSSYYVRFLSIIFGHLCNITGPFTGLRIKIKMFEPNVFGCLPSSGLKNDDRPHVHIYGHICYVIPDGKVWRREITCLFKLGRNCWIISPSTILRLWNVCAEEKDRC